MISHGLTLVHDITNITVFFHLPQILLLRSILIFNNFAWIWVNLVRQTCQVNVRLANQVTLPGFKTNGYPVHVTNVTSSRERMSIGG